MEIGGAVERVVSSLEALAEVDLDALRAVVEVRDRDCQCPSGCDEPIDACDVDHLVPWSHGGVTDQDNGRLLCRSHNRIESQYARPPNWIGDRSGTISPAAG
ncbi:MAG: HNH endonuclease signature motif containing protein [Ilumatobacteraceae bacterium]